MQNPNSHNSLDRMLHDFYLGNTSLAKLSLDIENMFFKNPPLSKENIFITGLARSGTTSIFNYLYESNKYASLLYSDMPFLLMPNLWDKLHTKKIQPKSERFHGDNILVGNDSPEALDEFFWKVFLGNSYVKNDFLALNNITDDILEKYQGYISLICRARGKSKYISKNNNSILRLLHLLKMNSPSKIILLYRNPIDHASSLMKLHLRFSELMKKDKFTLRYFNYLGHHEFGLNQKPFLLDQVTDSSILTQEKTSLDFWITSWINYYNYILNNFSDNITLISFEDLCAGPEKPYSYLKEILNISDYEKTPSPYTAPIYYEKNESSKILNEQALEIYKELNKKREYI
jgi:hypothetical protein